MFGKLWQHNPCDQMDNFLLGNLILTFTLRQVSLLGYGCVKTTFYFVLYDFCNYLWWLFCTNGNYCMLHIRNLAWISVNIGYRLRIKLKAPFSVIIVGLLN